MDLKINGQAVSGQARVIKDSRGQHKLVGRFGVDLMSSLGDFIEEKLDAQGDDQLVGAEGMVEFEGKLYEFACNVTLSNPRIKEVMYVDFASKGTALKWTKVMD